MRKITNGITLELTAEERELLEKIYHFWGQLDEEFSDVDFEDFGDIICTAAYCGKEVFINGEKIAITYTD